MRLLSILASAAAVVTATIATPAAALVVTSTSSPGGNLVSQSELSSSQASLDFQIFALSPITVNFGIQAQDAATYNFDSVIDIFTGVGPAATGVSTLVLGLTNGATFNPGTVSPAFSNATTSLNAARNAFTISFSPEENFGLTLGSIDSVVGDFGINRNGLAADAGFALTLEAVPAIPEPATWMMMIAGLGIAGFGLRRARSTGRETPAHA